MTIDKVVENYISIQFGIENYLVYIENRSSKANDGEGEQCAKQQQRHHKKIDGKIMTMTINDKGTTRK
jgi:hypothetical protein